MDGFAPDILGRYKPVPMLPSRYLTYKASTVPIQETTINPCFSTSSITEAEKCTM
jgi:hypothetical protein